MQMADNQTTTDTPASKPVKAAAPAAVQKAKETEVTETVVLETSTFDPTKATLVDEAEELFRTNVREAYGDNTLSNVELVKVNHRVGHSAEYVFRGKLV